MSSSRVVGSGSRPSIPNNQDERAGTVWKSAWKLDTNWESCKL